jgi:hypothetical protein
MIDMREPCSTLVRVPVKLASVNRSGFGMSRGAAMARAAEIKRVRHMIGWQVRVARGLDLRMPIAVLVTRIGPRRLDADNNIAAAKPAIDALADVLGVNDRTFRIGEDGPGVELLFAQRSEGPRRYAVELELRYG